MYLRDTLPTPQNDLQTGIHVDCACVFTYASMLVCSCIYGTERTTLDVILQSLFNFLFVLRQSLPDLELLE